MGRWERFWWAFYQANGYGFWFGMRQAWRFATGPAKLAYLSRQVSREFARSVRAEHDKQSRKAG